MKDNFNHRRYERCDISNRLQARKGSVVQESGGAKAGKREGGGGECVQKEQEQ